MSEQLSFTAALDRDALGQVAHAAYRAWATRMGIRNYHDTGWGDLPESTREAYRVSAEAVANAVKESPHE